MLSRILLNLRLPLRNLWQQRMLILAMTRRDIAARYRGASLGALWMLLSPILMLAVYSFVFGVVFQVRWGGLGDSKLHFAVVLFCGIAIFTLFSEVINRSPLLILENQNYVKKVVFPLDALACIQVLSSSFNFLIALGVLLLFHLIALGPPPLTVLALPLALLPFMLALIGLGWLLSSVGVYIRDMAQLTGFLATMMMFLSPVFYPLSAVPVAYQPMLWLNPITHVVEMFRGILIFGHWPAWDRLLLWWALALLMLVIGHGLLRRLRPGFSDAL